MINEIPPLPLLILYTVLSIYSYLILTRKDCPQMGTVEYNGLT